MWLGGCGRGQDIRGGAKGGGANSGGVSGWWAGLTPNGGVASRERAWLGDWGRDKAAVGVASRLGAGLRVGEPIAVR